MLDYGVHFASYQIGPSAYNLVAPICAPYGKRVLLIGGKTAMEQGVPTLKAAIAGSSLKLVDCVLYGQDCTYTEINRLAKYCNDLSVDIVFGMGGGKALDTAKGTANACGLPLFTFPTIASTCAATTALSVVYKEDGTLDEFAFFDKPAICAFINTPIIAQAPDRFLRAGMGDTLGKYYECHFSARGDRLLHSSALGREISNMCCAPLLEYGEQALADCRQNLVTEALQEIVLAIVVSTGLVSLLVNDDYNCAIAHSIFYGLAALPGFEDAYLHGDVVAYGVLVQLAIDNQLEELTKIRRFLKVLGIAVTLAEMEVSLAPENLAPVLSEAAASPDMVHLPYPVTQDMIYRGMQFVEALTD